MEVLSVTFAHNVETFKGLKDFEKLISQSLASEKNLEGLKEKHAFKFNEEISNVSSIKIYQHTGQILNKKAKLIAELPCTLATEKRILDKLSNGEL